MNIFDPIILSWKGREFTIPPDKVMGAIARIEDTVTLEELQRYARRATAPLAKLCTAYSDVLRYAGARVTADEVYAGMFFRKGSGADAVTPAITGLLGMMVPPARDDDSDTIPGEHPPGNVRPAAARASRPRSRSRSARANG